MTSSTRLAVLAVLVSVGAVIAYPLLLRVPLVRKRAPDFTLTDAAGRPVSLADFRGTKPVTRNFQVRPDPADVLRAVRSL